LLLAVAQTAFGKDISGSYAFDLLSPALKIDQIKIRNIFLKDAPNRDIVANNGEILLYRDMGVILSGKNGVGKTAFSFLALDNPSWELVSNQVGYLYTQPSGENNKYELWGMGNINGGGYTGRWESWMPALPAKNKVPKRVGEFKIRLLVVFDDWFVRDVYPDFHLSNAGADIESIFGIKLFDASKYPTTTLNELKQLLVKVEETASKLAPLTNASLGIDNSI
jgi:hypothetical protein